MNDNNNITEEISSNRLPSNDKIDEFTDALGSELDQPNSLLTQPKFTTNRLSTHLNRTPSNGIVQHHQQLQPSNSVSGQDKTGQVLDTSTNTTTTTTTATTTTTTTTTTNTTSDSTPRDTENEKLYKKPEWMLFRSVDVGSVFTMDVTDQDCEICSDDAEDLHCFDFDNDYMNVSSSSNSNRLLNMHLGCRSPLSNSMKKPKSQSQVKFKLNHARGGHRNANMCNDRCNIGLDEGHACENVDASDDEELDRNSYDNEIEGMLSEEEADNTLGATSGVMMINNDNGVNRKQLYPKMTRQLSASLPIQVPVNIMKASKGFKESHHDDLYENDDDSLSDDYAAILADPSKIPESIEALARSVRDSTEVFGALPSRRFNTGELVRSLRLT